MESQTQVQVQEQKLSQGQFLESVQYLLEASVGVITYIRGIFPDDAFEEDFLSYRNKNQQQVAKQGVRLMRLKRNQKDTCKVLDILKLGVFDALKRGHLKALLLYIFLDPKNPSDIYEKYDFRFSFSPKGQQNLNIINQKGAIIADYSLEPQTPQALKKQLQKLLRQLIVATQSLDSLPGGPKYLSMKLLFNDGCPESYQPPMFKDSTDGSELSFFINETQISPLELQVGTLKSSFHSVGLCVATLADGSYDNQDSFHKKSRVAAEKLNCHNGGTFQSSEISVFSEEKAIQSRTRTGFDALLAPEKPLDCSLTQRSTSQISTIQPSENLDEDLSCLALKDTSIIESDHDGSSTSLNCICGSRRNSCAKVICQRCHHCVHSWCHGIGDLKAFKSQFICLLCYTKSGIINSNIYQDWRKLSAIRKVYMYLNEHNLSSVPELARDIDLDLRSVSSVMEIFLKVRLVQTKNKSYKSVNAYDVIYTKISKEMDNFIKHLLFNESSYPLQCLGEGSKTHSLSSREKEIKDLVLSRFLGRTNVDQPIKSFQENKRKSSDEFEKERIAKKGKTSILLEPVTI